MIQAPPNKFDAVQMETEMLKWWAENEIFRRSVEERRSGEAFIFLEGPPTANGKPGIHHVLARTFKDLVCRIETMRGRLVERKAGWDTHGLPVELEVEKQLGIKSKKEIEAHGVKDFNQRCANSVFAYEQEWRKMTERMAFWLDLDNPYITLNSDYIESVWWALKTTWDKGLLYKGFRIVPYCSRCGTGLSSHEVGLGYKDVKERSVTAKFALKGEEDTFVLAWTTTPWTLPGNVALAVGAEIDYLKVEQTERGMTEYYYIAESRAESTLTGEWKVIERLKGKDLEGKQYEPLFDFMDLRAADSDKKAYYVTLADFVTTEEGTGVVHTAVMYGEDDYQLGIEIGLPAVHTVNLQGHFNELVPPWEGKFVKDVEDEILDWLDQHNRMYRPQWYTHSYPYCWRCDTPLLYYALDSWFIAMKKVKTQIQTNNSQAAWFPGHLSRTDEAEEDHVRVGRFGDFLKNLKDWSLSRERYWGTPLPIWSCNSEDCDEVFCAGSRKDLQDRGAGDLPDLHKPMIDDVTFPCETCSGTMVREPYVIDCWYDSGAAPFAQFHYPFENKERFENSFPVDYISEAVDQTRGWFYTLLAISTVVFDSLAYKRVLSLGHILDKEGKKMSKSKGNIVNPWDIFNELGADTLRWYLVSVNPPWEPTRFDHRGLKETHSRFVLTLWNSYSFFAQYASLDNYQPAQTGTPSVLDHWILSRLATVADTFWKHYDSYEIHKMSRVMEEFVVSDLSNWYIRRSRSRVWKEDDDPDKLACYSTLHTVIRGVTQLCAPIIPHLADFIFQGIEGGSDSVHLSLYGDSPAQDPALESSMAALIKLTEAGRQLRSTAQVKGRQPLAKATLFVADNQRGGLQPLLGILQEELNVKEVQFAADLEQHQQIVLRPLPKKMGPRLKGLAQGAIDALKTADATEVATALETGEWKTSVDGNSISVLPEDVEIMRQSPPGVTIATVEGMAIMLDLEVGPELRQEGLAREVKRRISQMRKDLGLDLTDRATATLSGYEEIVAAVEKWKAWLEEETRSTIAIVTDPPAGSKGWDIDGLELHLLVQKA